MAVAGDEVADAGRHQQAGGGESAGSEAGQHHGGLRQVLAGDGEAVGERRQDDRGGALLVLVEHGDVEAVLEEALHLEAARRRDVGQVDAGEHRRGERDDLGDLLGVAHRERQRERVDAGELLQVGALGLQGRQRRQRPQVALAHDRGAVAYHHHAGALDGVVQGLLEVVVDGHAHAGDAGGCRPWRGRRGWRTGTRLRMPTMPPMWRQEHPVVGGLDGDPLEAERPP